MLYSRAQADVGPKFNDRRHQVSIIGSVWLVEAVIACMQPRAGFLLHPRDQRNQTGFCFRGVIETGNAADIQAPLSAKTKKPFGG